MNDLRTFIFLNEEETSSCTMKCPSNLHQCSARNEKGQLMGFQITFTFSFRKRWHILTKPEMHIFPTDTIPIGGKIAQE